MSTGPHKRSDPASKILWIAPPWWWRWRGGIRETPMMMAGLLWLCTLPVVLLLIVPFWGAAAGLTAAAILFLAVLLVCLGICTSEAPTVDKSQRPTP